MGYDNTGVTFTSLDGDVVRYTGDRRGVLQEVKPRGGDWMRVGVANKLRYDRKKKTLSDQDGVAFAVPDSVLLDVAAFADRCGVRHNIKTPAEEVVFTAPSGDQIKLGPHSSGTGIVEYLMCDGRWVEVNVAASLMYDSSTRGLLDQDGGGGVLPSHKVERLLKAILNLAESCSVRTNIRQVLGATESRKTHKSPRKSHTSSSRPREQLTADNFWMNFVTEADRIDREHRAVSNAVPTYERPGSSRAFY